MNKIYLSILLMFLISFFASAQIYVASSGDDTNPGTFQQPYKTIPKAISVIQPGDTVYLRGGVYSSLTIPINISIDASESARYYLFAYSGERPVLDFSSMLINSGNRGINLKGDYWHLKGFDIKGAGDNGMNVTGSFNIIEFCSFYENHDTGLQLGGGASNNKVINCDSYFNSDPGEGNADGFAPKLDVGVNNYFYGCRAWQNSDDGWDGYLRGSNNVSTVIENSWCFANGYLKNGSASSGNGNGYKMGGGDNGNSANLAHNFTIINSLSFDNRVKGFDQNNNRGSMTLHNNSAYRNGTNYSIPSSINGSEIAEIINCAALGNSGSLSGLVVQQTNSWQNPFVVTNDDFVSVDTSGVRAPRKADGSLPDIDFLHLASGSDLIDGGTDIGLPFAGSAPDLGAFEKGFVVPVELVSFSAAIIDNNILLSWATATETNNFGFEIQKKFGNNEFKTIKFIPGSGTTTEKKEYFFLDKNVNKSNFYRLKQIDFDGSFSYSNEVDVDFDMPSQFSLDQNYPNPFNPNTSIKFTIAEKGNISLRIYNIIGEAVSTLIDNKLMEAGSYNINFNAESLTSGAYIYVLQAGAYSSSKKMILIK